MVTKLPLLMRRPWLLLIVGSWLVPAAPARAAEPPPDLPRYTLTVRLDTTQHTVLVRERVTWTNRHQRPTNELVFNVYPHFKLPDGDVALVAKTIELLRQDPGVALDTAGRAGNVTAVALLNGPVPPSPPEAGGEGRTRIGAEGGPTPLATYYQSDIDSALVVSLPQPVGPGESVTVELDYTLTLPNKQGRWGYWDDVTFLNHWMPTLAYYDDTGWQPTPFIPWHQPFYLEAGVYAAAISLPADQKLACSGPVRATKDLGNGWKLVETEPCLLRDFALMCSARYEEHTSEMDGITIKCFALPEHDWYAREMMRIAGEAIPVYSRWFGPFPYKHFTVAESFFPWNGNECGALVMIDHRVFQMPHLGRGYVDYLLSHEILHQWWYNAVGTDGYRETWMDEGVATYFSHRMLNQKYGKNNTLLEWPSGLGWLPNIHRENYRYYARVGSIRRGDDVPAVVPKMEDFNTVVGLFSGAYDRGSKVVGMIEDRLGEAATFDFFRQLYQRYYFRVMHVADFKRELETYTGRSWDDFFKNWVYGKGLTDWKVETVSIRTRSAVEPSVLDGKNASPVAFVTPENIKKPDQSHPYEVTVILRQQAQIDEPTNLGFQFRQPDNYSVRIPINPQIQRLTLQDPPASVEVLPDHRIRVTVQLAEEPTQIAVDPDQILEDPEPANNYWKPRERWRWTPLYTQLEEADLMNDYDRWNFIVGPWVYASATRDPWFQKPSYAGLRAGAIRTQQFDGGVYAAFRSDYRDLVVGTDGLIDHWPLPKTQIGYLVERRVAAPIGTEGPDSALRAVVYGRYIFQYTSAMYLNPMKYAETFATYQDNPLPFARTVTPGALRLEHMTAGGLHYHIDYLTPYWDPVAGYRFDATYTGGTTDLQGRGDVPLNKLESQATLVHGLPQSWGWFSDTRLAGRISVAGAFPDEGEHFALGGSYLFRGFDLAERQGSMLWVGNIEWRVPVVRRLDWDICDHVAGLRNISVVGFYDVGAIYANGHAVGDVAHALGAGLRLDVTWFSFIERSVVRFDAAKTINAASPWQFWLGVQHAF
jgi:hypothetical protein